MVYLLYPDQLFEDILKQKEIKRAVLVEEPLVFKQFAFHKKKLIFHRASMKAFAEKLIAHGFEVIYLDSNRIKTSIDVVSILKSHGITKVHLFELNDNWLEKRLKSTNLEIISHPSPAFYLSRSEMEEEFKDQTKFSMASFYIHQRKRFNILMESGKPAGGKWSFDTENRKKLPKTVKLPPVPHSNKNSHIEEATHYIEKHFSTNYGLSEDFFYPVTHEEATKWLTTFFHEKLFFFGDYQDAILQDDSLVFHSILSPLINSGLLTPVEVVKKAIAYAQKYDSPLNCLEGFVRQILGWREFVRGVYCSIGSVERTKNFWGHTRPLPESFWTATTGIAPIDNVIEKVTKTSYAHHIERLMVMANFMLLCEIKPDDVYRWFMELFIDAYDWVMVPNVYGMGLYADGGMITTKPYISGSNYIHKMSDFPKGEWSEIWNSLYWNFIEKHKQVFAKNPRCGPVLLTLNKMTPETKKAHLARAKKFLSSLDV
jgi:deoxyribodipyrimidine photolyase-related protein